MEIIILSLKHYFVFFQHSKTTKMFMSTCVLYGKFPLTYNYNNGYFPYSNNQRTQMRYFNYMTMRLFLYYNQIIL